MLNTEKLCADLQERFPQWSGWIARLELEDAPCDAPTDNDGRRVLYNSRLMSYCTEEVQRFYIAQQLLHLRLNHHDRGRGRDRLVWRRAADAVVIPIHTYHRK